ncbi:hypothetical protein BT69DRAFT_1359286 [Atractiella rhizophila]|nr:hypothetical protein BT69DRAFT_1359286 [Atractiella rhizophila]
MPSTSQHKLQVKESAIEKATSPSPTTTDDTFVTCLEIESAIQVAIPAPVLARGTVAEDGEGGARKKGKKKKKGSGKAACLVLYHRDRYTALIAHRSR